MVSLWSTLLFSFGAIFMRPPPLYNVWCADILPLLLFRGDKQNKIFLCIAMQRNSRFSCLQNPEIEGASAVAGRQNLCISV